MTWARFDDLYDDHRKVKRAWRRHPRAVGLHAMAITYSARHETDGLVDAEWIEEKVPTRGERTKVLGVLVDLGLFEPADSGAYRVHDYLDYNPSSDTLTARRRADSERKAAGRAAESNGSPKRVRPDSERNPVSLGSAGAGPRPGPALPNPCSPSSPGSDQDTHAGGEEVDPDIDRLCRLLADLMRGNDPKAKVAPESVRWRDACRLLLEKDERPAAEVERILRWSQADEFWRTNILSMPKLREQFGALKLRMESDGVRQAFDKPAPASSAQLGAALSRSSRTGVRP